MLDLDMGKHAVYVWGAYGVAVIAVAGLIVLSLSVRAQRMARLKALADAAKAP